MKRRDEVLVGIVITVALAVGIIGTLWLARGGLSAGYPLYAVFDWGEGLKQGQPVLLSGVNAGYVSDVTFNQDGTIGVRMNIDEDYKVPDNSTATVVPVGFFGDKAVGLKPARPSTSYFDPGDTVPRGEAGPSMDQILARLDTVSSSVSDVTRSLEFELVDSGGIRDLRGTLAATNELVRSLAGVAAEQSRQLTLTQQSLRRSVSAIDSASVDSTVRNLSAASANLTTLTRELSTASTQMNQLLARLDRDEGTAGKLLTDSLLYSDIRRLVTRMDSVTADFKKNPRRYINLEIF